MNIPIKYLPKKLTKKDKKILKKELKKSRKGYKKGKYITRKKVKSFKSKKSQHILNAERIYKLKNLAANKELVKKTGCSLKSLNAIIKKGQGAYYSSGSRPNQTGHSWGYARLGSSITGGKASAVDFNILNNGCTKNSKALRLAKNARKKFGYGTRKVPKTKI
jgi:nitrate reductase beta subunit